MPRAFCICRCYLSGGLLPFHRAIHVHFLADFQDSLQNQRGGCGLRAGEVRRDHQLAELVAERRSLQAGVLGTVGEIDAALLGVIPGDGDSRMGFQGRKGRGVDLVGIRFEDHGGDVVAVAILSLMAHLLDLP